LSGTDDPHPRVLKELKEVKHNVASLLNMMCNPSFQWAVVLGE